MIRRVRTPEGAKFYGAPIGTPIVADKGKIKALISDPSLGGNDPDFVKTKKRVVAKNALPKPNRPHVKWVRKAVVMDGLDGYEPRKGSHRPPTFVVTEEGSDFPALMMEFDFNDDVIQGIMDDRQTVIESLPTDLKNIPVGVFVAQDDPVFSPDGLDSLDQTIGGYTMVGSTLIHLNPLVAVNSPMVPEDGWDWTDHPPYYDYLAPRLSTMMHESGHVVSMQRKTIQGSQAWPVQDFAARYESRMGGYSTTHAQEAYAEMYAQYKIGGPGSSEVADAWAEEFQWDGLSWW